MIFIGNWKMNPATRAAVDEYVRDFVEAHRTLQESGDVEFWIAPPSLYIPLLVEMLAPEVSIGAQDVSEEEKGARTGEISATMAGDAGAAFALLGHSERRRYHGEGNALVSQKVSRILESGMRAVVCVGESHEDRDAGSAKDVVSRQVRECLEGVRHCEESIACHCEKSIACHCEESIACHCEESIGCHCEESATKQSPNHEGDCHTPRGLGARNDSTCARDSSTRGLTRNDKSTSLRGGVRDDAAVPKRLLKTQNHEGDCHTPRGLGARNDSACARDSSTCLPTQRCYGRTGGLARNDESNILIAYEPVWAIGSGSVPSAAEIREMRDVIRDELKTMFGESAKNIPILYGGSVTSENAWETITAPAMDGALIGGASLEAKEFVQIGILGGYS